MTALMAAISVSAGEVARVRFFADSDIKPFYAKLSTKWEHQDYATYFVNQDAYLFDFIGSPKLSATSRASLEIYYPFTDSEGNPTVSPDEVNIYQVIDGDLYNITSHFTFEENADGAAVFATRTRFLGTYIMCEKPIEELDANGVSPLAAEDGYATSTTTEDKVVKQAEKKASTKTGITLPSKAK